MEECAVLKEASSGDDFPQILTKQENFIQHERIHKEKPSSCDVCDVVRINTGKKFDKFSCVDCGITFGKHIGLIKHKRVHSMIKPYQCDFCDQSFTQANSLFQHKQVHTEVVRWHNEETPNEFSVNSDKMLKQISKTYSNPVKKFKGQNNLLQNEGRYKEKPLTRDICEAKPDTFSCDDRGELSSNSDKKVTKISETFVKNDEKTKAQNDLLLNGRIEEKSFVCDVCDELFTKKQYLIRHRGIHIGEKFGRYSCDDCGITFGKHVALILHKRIHTENETVDLLDKEGAINGENSMYLPPYSDIYVGCRSQIIEEWQIEWDYSSKIKASAIAALHPAPILKPCCVVLDMRCS
ncbi:zinc finger protein 271-like [Chrysoperla carnea]|uniref:zinc finger protein 271-like n=1 Tax=Chrysoperla carnea TaxID=189513 RepID=UPI001D06CB67|nr:zinc finger protein 271-like [Chrysoperla carnea]